MNRQRLLDDMLDRLREGAAERLASVVLYGPGAHGDEYAMGDLNLMIVLRDLSPPTLEGVAGAIRWWVGKKQPWPRLFSPETIEASADVFPIEFLDIVRHHRVLHGDDPLAALRVESPHLRLQCERDLREKQMRLREAYVETCGRDKALRELLIAAYASFAFVFRGCLELVGATVPVRDGDVLRLACERLDLDSSVVADMSNLAKTGSSKEPIDGLYARFDEFIDVAVGRIDNYVSYERDATREGEL